jgi:phosphoserine phosphatase RsbU/P
VLLAIVVLIRRFGRGLIDTSPSKVDAIVGGLALLIFIALNSTGKLARGEPSGTLDILGPLFAVLFAGIGGFILIFLISVYASSISQEVWPQKLKQLNLLRKGYIINQPLGMTFIRSVLYGLVMGGIYILYTGLVPHNGLIWSDEYVFYSDRTILSSVHLLGSSVFGAIFFLFNFILGINTLIYRKFRKGWVSILTIMTLWTIGGFITFEVINFWYNLPLVMVVGLLVGWIFWNHGPVTSILSYVLFELFVVSISGFWISSNPDFWNMMVLIAVPFSIMFVGIRGIRSNTTSEELPDYIPSYLIELANRERMERELEIARQVQLSFLPEKTPVYEGIQLSADCHPASEVGGDYYDFLPTADGRLGLVIGDVSGKGIQAAFYMTLIKGFTQSLSDDMTIIIAKLNDN